MGKWAYNPYKWSCMTGKGPLCAIHPTFRRVYHQQLRLCIFGSINMVLIGFRNTIGSQV